MDTYRHTLRKKIDEEEQNFVLATFKFCNGLVPVQPNQEELC